MSKIFKISSEVDIWVENILGNPEMFYNCPLHLKNNYKIKQAYKNAKTQELQPIINEVKNKFNNNSRYDICEYLKSIKRSFPEQEYRQVLNGTLSEIVAVIKDLWILYRDGLSSRNTHLGEEQLYITNEYSNNVRTEISNALYDFFKERINNIAITETSGASYYHGQIKEIKTMLTICSPTIHSSLKKYLFDLLYDHITNGNFLQKSIDNNTGLYPLDSIHLWDEIFGDSLLNAILPYLRSLNIDQYGKNKVNSFFDNKVYNLT